MNKIWKWVKSIFKKESSGPSSSSGGTTTAGPSQGNPYKVFYPHAVFDPKQKSMVKRGTYKDGIPEGAIVHFTAGWQNSTGTGMIRDANTNGYLYLFIDEKGQVWQQFSLDSWGNHAGSSTCPVTKRTNVSRFYVGIEIAAGGRVDSNTRKTWFGKKVNNARYFAGNKLQTAGWYEPYTEAQEKSLIELLKWLVDQGMNSNYIFGHDEVSPGRKNDPGGALSMGMDKLRETIREYSINALIAEFGSDESKSA